MPDAYWEGVRRNIEKKQEELLASGTATRCARCGQLYEQSDRPETGGGSQVCASCKGSRAGFSRPRDAWRGRGSFGKRPSGYGRTPEQINESE